MNEVPDSEEVIKIYPPAWGYYLGNILWFIFPFIMAYARPDRVLCSPLIPVFYILLFPLTILLNIYVRKVEIFEEYGKFYYHFLGEEIVKWKNIQKVIIEDSRHGRRCFVYFDENGKTYNVRFYTNKAVIKEFPDLLNEIIRRAYLTQTQSTLFSQRYERLTDEQA